MAVSKAETGQLAPSLERRIAAARARMERQRAEGIDPEAEWRAFVRRTDDRETLIAAYRAWMAEQGHPLEDQEPEDDATDADAW